MGRERRADLDAAFMTRIKVFGDLAAHLVRVRTTP
jgi:hypothetical protein